MRVLLLGLPTKDNTTATTTIYDSFFLEVSRNIENKLQLQEDEVQL